MQNRLVMEATMDQNTQPEFDFSGTFNQLQLSEKRSCVFRTSDLLAEYTSRAAAFSTDCSSVTDTPAMTAEKIMQLAYAIRRTLALKNRRSKSKQETNYKYKVSYREQIVE